MPEANPNSTNNRETLPKTAGADTQELVVEEPEAVNVVIDGISPSDFRGGRKRKRRLPRVLLATGALVVVSVTLGILLGPAQKKEDPPPAVLRTSTSSPSQSPSFSPSSPSSAVVAEFLSGLPAYSLDLAENDADSPQAKALAWLQQDPKFNEYKDSYRLYQRYALAVLYLSTNGTSSWDADRGWLSNDNECDWYTSDWFKSDMYFSASVVDICGASSRLSGLHLVENGLDGSIPRELGLLSDLETMQLSDGTLTGTIPPELCVSRLSRFPVS
jgi:hypothetical protein